MLKIALVYPDLLGTYGDSGNAAALAYRSRARHIATEVLSVQADDVLPDADIYLLGGGEDGPQRMATDLLRKSSFVKRVHDGANVVAVCAGLQILGTSFSVEGAATYEGLGIVPVTTVRGQQRSVGNVAVDIDGSLLVGFENHGGVTSIGEVPPLGAVVRGVGNDGVVDGYRYLNVVATYAHGPVLALNPWFCDVLLERALGHSLDVLPSVADALYADRLRVVLGR